MLRTEDTKLNRLQFLHSNCLDSRDGMKWCIHEQGILGASGLACEHRGLRQVREAFLENGGSYSLLRWSWVNFSSTLGEEKKRREKEGKAKAETLRREQRTEDCKLGGDRRFWVAGAWSAREPMKTQDTSSLIQKPRLHVCLNQGMSSVPKVPYFLKSFSLPFYTA